MSAASLMLNRDLAGRGPEHRWARWQVHDEGGHLVGTVVETREWLGHTYGPSTYSVAHNPTGEAFGARWRVDELASPQACVEALADHLARLEARSPRE